MGGAMPPYLFTPLFLFGILMADFSALTILRAIANVANGFVEIYVANGNDVNYRKAAEANVVIELYDSDEADKVTFLLNNAYNQGRNDAMKELAAKLTSGTQQPTAINPIKKE
jgi:hypothetical protein